MASTANNASSVESTPSNIVTASSAAQKDGTGKVLKQNNTAAKMNDKSRRESPSGRGPVSKAWSGPNPITQRTYTPSQSNGSVSQTRATSSRGMSGEKKELSDMHSHDRLQFLIGGAIGLPVVLTTKAGDKFEGIFAGLAGLPNDGRITLKMTKRIMSSPITQSNGTVSREAAFTGSSPDHTMSIELRDMADMAIPEFSLPEITKHTNGTPTPFQTDSDISGNALRGERTLQRWVPDTQSSDDFSMDVNHAGGWDQFATHQRMTGGQSTYSEDIYTTAINRNAPGFSRREAEAARLAREIESEASSNVHVREERGQVLEAENDNEEDRYSGVKRSESVILPRVDSGEDTYTPTISRAQDARFMTNDLPSDPAIISAQPARPGVVRAPYPHASGSVKSHTVPSKRTPDLKETTVAISSNSIDIGSGTGMATESLRAPDSAAVAGAPATTDPPMSAHLPKSTETSSDRVEDKLLLQFRRFADIERARVAEKKRVQASHDRTAKINDLVRFSKTFKLKTPVPDDLVGILAKDPKKQEVIVQKAKQDSEIAKVNAAILGPSSVDEPQPIPKFDRSQVPPPVPTDRGVFQAQRAQYGKQSLPRNTRPPVLQPGFPGGCIPIAPRGQSATVRDRTAPAVDPPIPLPVPELRPSQTGGDRSNLSSPRGSDGAAAAASSRFNVRAMEFKPTAPPFNPSGTPLTTGSPSPVAQRVPVVEATTPSAFFGSKKPLPAKDRLDISKAFDPIPRMKTEVEADKNKKTDKPAPDFAWNGGIRPAYDSPVTWTVSDKNQDATYEDHFRRQAPAMSSPVQSRSGSSNAMVYTGPITNAGAGYMPPNLAPHHMHAGVPHFQQQFEEQRLHNMQNGIPSTYASPSMTPRSIYVTPMGPPAQIPFGQPGYFSNVPQHMRGYAGTPSMPHVTPGQTVAPLMAPQHSSGPYVSMQQQFGYGSPTPGHIYPASGYPSPGRVAPMMLHQGSQPGHSVAPQMVYGVVPGGPIYGQPHMRGGYGSGMASYGTSPHQTHYMGQRTMSTGYGKPPPIGANTGPVVNTPPQAGSYVPSQEEPK